MWKTKSSKNRIERLEEVLKASRAMKELAEELPWIEAIMAPAVRGNLNMNKAVVTKMVCVRAKKEAAQIGRNLVLALKGKKLITAGVDQWRVQNRAVKQLMERTCGPNQ